MTDYIVQGESLESVADAIREKTGGDSPLEFPADFITALDGLVDTSDATATGMDILAGKTAYVDGELIHGAIPSKTSADLTASGDTVIVPSGYYDEEASKSVASGSVTIPDSAIGATPSISVSAGGLISAAVNTSKTLEASVTPGYVSSVPSAIIPVVGSATEQLPTQAAQTITPTTTDQTIASGKYLTGAQTIKGDANLIPANIADGVTIFGVVGTHQGGGTQPTLFAPVVTGGVNTISWSNNPSNGDFVVTLTADVDGTPVTSPLTITEQMDGSTLTITASATNFESVSSTILLEYIEPGLSLMAIGADTAIGDKTETAFLTIYDPTMFDTLYEGDSVGTSSIHPMITSNGAAVNKTETKQYSVTAKQNFSTFSWYISTGLYTGNDFGFIRTNVAPGLGSGSWSNNLSFTISLYNLITAFIIIIVDDVW